MVEAEFLHQVIHAEELSPVIKTPAHQYDPVDHAFGDIPQSLQVLDENRITILHDHCGLALAHLAFTAGFEKNRKVNPLRFLPAISPDNMRMEWQSGEPFGAPDDVGDIHQVIIHHGSQVVQCQPI